MNGNYNELDFLRDIAQSERQIAEQGGIIDTDPTLAGNSDARVPSQKAVKTYADKMALRIGGNLYATSNTDLAINVASRLLKSIDGVTVLDFGHAGDAGGRALNIVFGDGTLTPGNTWGVRINTAGISTVDGDFGGATFSVDAVTGNVTAARGGIVLSDASPDHSAPQLAVGGWLINGERDGAMHSPNGFSVNSAGSFGIFGTTPVAAQPATPVTLADVISILQSYGLCA